MNNNPSLCEGCRNVREIVSGKGSRFLMCLLSQTDQRWKKYPAQPVFHCIGYERQDAVEALVADQGGS